MSTQTTRVMPAFIDIFTKPSDAIEHVASFTLTSVRPQHVEACMTSTDVFSSLTLIDINAARALFIEVVSSTAVNRVPLAGVRAHRVDTDLPPVAWTCLANTFIYINTVSKSILDKARSTLNFGQTTERPLGVLALKLRSTVMDTRLTLINIFAVVAVSELISCSTADFSLATERALRVDATLSSPTVAGSHQTLVDVLTALSIWFEFIAFEAGTSVIPHTAMSTLPIALII